MKKNASHSPMLVRERDAKRRDCHEPRTERSGVRGCEVSSAGVPGWGRCDDNSLDAIYIYILLYNIVPVQGLRFISSDSPRTPLRSVRGLTESVALRRLSKQHWVATVHLSNYSPILQQRPCHRVSGVRRIRLKSQ